MNSVTGSEPREGSKVVPPITGEDVGAGIPRVRAGLGVQITVDQQVCGVPGTLTMWMMQCNLPNHC
jgi:hypothetical protein